MSSEILIRDGGRILSRVVVGDSLTQAVGLTAPRREIFLVADSAVGVFSASLSSALQEQGVRVHLFELSVSEEDKDMRSVLSLCRWLLTEGADRTSLLVAMGGGITTDLAGFAASIYRRGIGYCNIPTTLLSQVDAGIGGKTGVNFEGLKNMLGVIRQPEWTFICPEVLGTLPRRDFVSGAAEMLKTFIIDNSSASYDLAAEALAKGPEAPGLGPLIFNAAAVKAGIVGRDQFEGGERKKLNLGHTFAHAIEQQARLHGDDITHGEAVAMGTILSARVSERKGLAMSGFAARIEADFARIGLPTKCPYAPGELAGAMGKDKKAEGGLVSFILPEAIGKVSIVPSTVSDILSL